MGCMILKQTATITPSIADVVRQAITSAPLFSRFGRNRTMEISSPARLKLPIRLSAAKRAVAMPTCCAV